MNAPIGSPSVRFILVLIRVHFGNTDLKGKSEALGTPTSISESLSLDFFYLYIYPTSLFITNKALFTTIFVPRYNKQHQTLFGACHHYSSTSQMDAVE